jgi:hypothetical protein
VDAEVREVLFLSIVSASLSFTISETKIFRPLRWYLMRLSSFLGDLVCCGYCLGFWFSCLLCLIHQPTLINKYHILDLILTYFIVAWLSGLQWAFMNLLMVAIKK